jgi:hypothetical protein
MGGKGELVKYTRRIEKGDPLTEKQKDELLKDITALIEGATQTITVIVLAEASNEDLKGELKRREKKY